MATLKKAQIGAVLKGLGKAAVKASVKAPKAIGRFSSEAERIAAGHATVLQNASGKGKLNSELTGIRKVDHLPGGKLNPKTVTGTPLKKPRHLTKEELMQKAIDDSYRKNGGKVKPCAKCGKTIKK